ncbi:SDR family NAD(P)-dependent oxidoreductase [Xanthobacter autotrophicus]|uniref:SDR family NAD(P)-dependent oxidoreductase n=1 Tax=Xanthobacter autotrophicus TaxID=280 RepID=UPI0024A74FF8|nr:SDR family oxidoreductase [Xanthobacter autotrophicus]MDI4655318.1 SDR family oxidoreductase [Xanthobacter autotrophicus]
MTYFEGKTVLITGAATGIGFATARRLTELGARIVIADLDGTGAEAAAQSLPAGCARGFRCDVREDAEVAKLREAVITECGTIDMLINNAARPPVTGPIIDTTLGEWRDALEVNVLGYVQMIKAFLPDMIARRSGHIVNTSSGLALLPDPPIRFMGPYIASKGAQLSMSYAFAHALAGTGVSVSVFCPGVTNTSDRPGGAPPPGPNMPAPADFRIGVPARRTERVSADHAAGILVEGLARNEFLICSQAGYLTDLIAFAKDNFDPQSIVREALAETS